MRDALVAWVSLLAVGCGRVEPDAKAEIRLSSVAQRGELSQFAQSFAEEQGCRAEEPRVARARRDMIFITIYCGRRVLAVIDNANRPDDRPWMYLYRQGDPTMRRRGLALSDATRRRWPVASLPIDASPLEFYPR